jgi:hypothetical protein
MTVIYTSPNGSTSTFNQTGYLLSQECDINAPRPFQLIKQGNAWIPATATVINQYNNVRVQSHWMLSVDGVFSCSIFYIQSGPNNPVLIGSYLPIIDESSVLLTVDLKSGTTTVQLSRMQILYNGETYISNGSGDGTAGISLQPLASGPVSVTFGSTPTGSAYQMFDSHTVQVNITGHFSQDPTTAKALSVEATINGIPVSSIYPLSSSAVGDQPKSLFIDLSTAGPAGSAVPKFADNQTFTLTATINEGSQTNTSQTDAEIPLPVVHVHGILTDCLGDRIPHKLFEYLKSAHPAYVEDPGVSNGTADNMLTPATYPYPTLVSFDYKSMQKSVTAVASDLDTFIRQQVLKQTYAAKVNIVAHSLGGIISRAAITFNGTGAVVNELILVGSPSEGATLAPLALNFWSTFRLVTLSAAIVYPPFADAAACILVGTQDTARELQPTYPWWAANKADVANGPLGIPAGSVAPVLGFLNSLGLDPGVKYYGLVAGGILTPTKLWGRNSLWPGELAAGKPPLSDNTAYEPGDGIVPLRSQEALETPWTRGSLAGQLNVYDNVGPVFHTDYFKAQRVNADVASILWQ